MIKLGGKEIKDECERCGEILVCELTRDGHGIQRERSRMTEMLKCQMEHECRRKGGKWA